MADSTGTQLTVTQSELGIMTQVSVFKKTTPVHYRLNILLRQSASISSQHLGLVMSLCLDYYLLQKDCPKD